MIHNDIPQKRSKNWWKSMFQNVGSLLQNSISQIIIWFFLFWKYNTGPMRNGPVKRTPGRLPRIPFTPHQLNELELAYKRANYLSSEDANRLAIQLDLTCVRVKIWFQNRRARERREKRELNASSSSSSTSSPLPSMLSLSKNSPLSWKTVSCSRIKISRVYIFPFFVLLIDKIVQKKKMRF